MIEKNHYRSVWISDLHLGSRGCNHRELKHFLQSFKTDTLYLVGDIIDGWALKNGSSYFPQGHVDIIRRFLQKSKKGTSVKYIIGNHDEFLRNYLDFFDRGIGSIEIVNETVHETVDGRKLWVIHADLYDKVILHNQWIAHIGDRCYTWLITINIFYNYIRRKLGYGYWSLSSYLKYKVKMAVQFITAFEETVAYECKKRGYDGVICGHIHHAEMKNIEGIQYFNCGDWVESCTAITEDFEGNFNIIYWVSDENTDCN
jgi:UDP-2,3-diacylglucosamine pyrophosphatase LpxH